MPTALLGLPLKADPPRKRWTRAEYQELSTALLDQQRLELVEGELISKMGKNGPHVSALIRLQHCLVQVFGALFVRPEAPVDVAPEDNPSSEPQPDIVVTGQDTSHFLVRNPSPADILLVVEISDTTLGFDLGAKARLYARAGIADYWVLDVPGRRLIVNREPAGGVYRNVTAYAEDEPVSPLAAPQTELRARDVLVP